ncbi:MAG: hypothetical protein ABF760_08060 [Zymomonas mobilis]|uniref:Uncharacterized protein n=1 Tax=Zymomonas mobilis TaxID=542 RepID=A0A542W2E4_ZYMMB|nr:hypothetical protein [Zymomonas mobilis]TQL17649.1 hypothetical protein FBY58_1247 [Zymomonas mobilis]
MPSFRIKNLITDSWAFLKRETKLIAPVALSTIGFGNLLILLLFPTKPALEMGSQPHVFPLAVLLIGASFNLIGILALSRLILFGGESVKNAFGVAFNRLVSIFAFLFTVSILLSVAFILVGMLVMKIYTMHHFPISTSMILSAAGLGLMLLLALHVKLFFWYTLMADKYSAFQAVKHSFALTRGRFWILLLILLPFLIGDYALSKWLGVAALSPSLKLVASIVVALLTTVITTIQLVVQATLYKSLRKNNL